MVMALLDSGAHINAPSGERWRPLHHAAGHMETLIALLDRGADIDARNKKGETPLLLSLLEGHQAVTVTLLERGCNWKVKEIGNSSVLNLAADRG